MNLDAKTVAAATLGSKRDAIFFDATLKGFGYRLRIGSGGKLMRTWVVQYKRAGGTRRLLLGSADVLSADKARAAAKRILAQVVLGQDPQADKADRRSKDQLSVRSIIDEYLAAKQQQVRGRTFNEVERYLTGPYFKALHSMPIDKVSRKDVASRLVSITNAASSITAARARSALSAFYVWSLKMGLVEVNPVNNTLKPKDSEGRKRVLTDAELAAIWRACGDNDYGKIVRLLILLGCRRAEIGGMCFEELDLEQGSWTLPAARSKNGEAHTLPLMPMALDIIKSVPRMVSRDQLFGVRGKGYSDWGGGKRALDERCKVTGWCLHDLRRTAATRMGDPLGVQPHIVEQILNHQGGHKSGVAGIYNKATYEREVRAALALWSDHIRTLVEGGERKVVAFTPTAS
jgi:integrase